jgi:hypothetical protein
MGDIGAVEVLRELRFDFDLKTRSGQQLVIEMGYSDP